uniref:tRNA pseudouridine synthase B n=1 Tax=Dictyoglomus turgidum TaxID=513050 RepID=A0A7C3WW21_9BACT
MNGFLLVNKPPGITSFDVVKKIRKITKIDKVGHMGTLDPRACGLIIIGLGKYVRLEKYILNFTKTYIVEIHFGIISETYDREAPFFRYQHIKKQDISPKKIEEILKRLLGEIEQEPPLYSALHINGKRAYELAREGKNLELPKRKVKIFKAELLDYKENKFPIALIEFKVSAGTYIRSLVKDIGEKLGCYTITSFLLRTEIGHISINDSIPFNKISKYWKENIISPVKILNFPLIKVDDQKEKRILNGNDVLLPTYEDKEILVSIVNSKDKFIAVGKIKGNVLKPEKVFSTE